MLPFPGTEAYQQKVSMYRHGGDAGLQIGSQIHTVYEAKWYTLAQTPSQITQFLCLVGLVITSQLYTWVAGE